MPAILAIPDIGAVVAGLVLLALAGALWLLRDLLVGALSHLPVVGGWVGSTLGGWIDAARSAVLHGADAAFGGAQTIFMAVAHWCTRMWDESISAVAEVLITVEHVITVQIPRALSAAVSFAVHQAGLVYADARAWFLEARAFTARAVAAAEHDIAAAAAAAGRDLADLRHWTAATFDGLRHDLARDYDAAIAWTDTQVRNVTNWAAREINAGQLAAEAYAYSLFRVAEHDITTATSAAEAYAAGAATAAEHAAVAAADAAATAGLAIPWAGIVTDLEALDTTLAGGWRDIRDAVDAIPRTVPADLAGALSAAAALAIPALRAMDDCVLPQCRDLGGLRSFVHDLMGVASAAAVLAWLAYCIGRPQAAADDTAAVGEPIAADTLGALERLFGVGT